MKLLLYILIVMDQTIRGECLDTSYTCCYTSLGKDLEAADLGGILNVGTAAELCGEVSHSYDTDLIAVFLSKERHRACLLCVLQTHNICNNRKCRADLFIYKALRTVLGTHVEQAGSLVTRDRLRFDFTHFSAMSQDEIKEVENIVNKEK